MTYNMACEYYRLGIKPVVRMAHEARAVYKIGKRLEYVLKNFRLLNRAEEQKVLSIFLYGKSGIG